MKYDEGRREQTPYDKILEGIHMPARSTEEIYREAAVPSEAPEAEVSSISEENNAEGLLAIDDAKSDSGIAEAPGYVEKNDEIGEPQSELKEVAANEVKEAVDINEVDEEDKAENVSQVNEAAEKDANYYSADRSVAEEEAEEYSQETSGYEEADLTEVLKDKKTYEACISPINDNAQSAKQESIANKFQGISKQEHADENIYSEKSELIGEKAVLKTIDFTEIYNEKPVRIYLEEDILVPDIKPDLASILSMSGVISTGEREIKTGMNSEHAVSVSGDIDLKTIYMPEKKCDEPVISVQSRIPFRAEKSVEIPAFTRLSVMPVIEKIEYSVINERKFRAKITVLLSMREYIKKSLDIFEGISGEEIQLLKEKMTVTDVAAHKNDTMEISESIVLKEALPEPLQILRYDIRAVENNKQITAERAVIGGSIYYSILYLAEREDGDGMAPFMCQGRTDFTQFISLNGAGDCSGSRVRFDDSDITVKISSGTYENSLLDEDYEKAYMDSDFKAEQGRHAFVLEGNLSTTVDVYRNLENEIAADVYHNEKELVFENDEFTCGALEGSSAAEMSIREIVNAPAEYGDIDRIIFVSGKLTDMEASAEYGKQTVSGNLEAEVLLLSTDENIKPFKMQQTIPFRTAMDIAGAKPGMTAECDMHIRELRCDKIGSRQIEITAGIFASGMVYSRETKALIKNPAFLAKEESSERKPQIVIYITKRDDSLWSIAKSFRTTTEKLEKINSLGEGSKIKEGMRLLVIV